MSKPNIIVERIKAHRADLVVKIQEADADIATREVRRNALSVELGNLDKLLAPTAAPAPKVPRGSRASRPVKVREHQRTVGTPEPGASLPLDQAAD